MKYKYLVTIRGNTFPIVLDKDSFADIIERMRKMSLEINGKEPVFGLIAPMEDWNTEGTVSGNRMLIFCCMDCVLAGEEAIGHITQLEDQEQNADMN